jgi:DNA-binding XRE family transcriptional regulator
MPGLTKKRPTRTSARITIEMPGAAIRVLEILPRDAQTALRMLEGIKLFPVAGRKDADEGPTLPWREAFSDVIAKHGGEVAAMVRAYRDAKGITQQQLADVVGLRKSNISEIERGKRPIGKGLARKLGLALDADYRMFL